MTATNQDTQTCGFSFAGMLRRVWPAGTAKRAAQAADTSHRTVENWVSGRASPSIETVFRMIEKDARLREALADELAALNERLRKGEQNVLSVLDSRHGDVRHVTSLPMGRHTIGAGW